MIASPCKHCVNVNSPKDQCIGTCQVLHAVQHMRMAQRDNGVETSSEYSEKHSLVIAASVGSVNAPGAIAHWTTEY